MELHIVIDSLGFVREQDGRQTLSQVADDLISGQFDDAYKVLRFVLPNPNWPHSRVIEDATDKIALEIHRKCSNGRQHVHRGSPAHKMVQRHVGIAHAELCLDQEEAA